MGVGGEIAGITATLQGLLDKAARLQDLSDAFNISAESIQKLGNVAATSNISLEEVGSKLGKIAQQAQKAAKDPSGDLAKTFAEIGVGVEELGRLNAFELFDRLRVAVQSGSLAGKELNIINQLLAKDYQRFAPLLRMTNEEFYRLAEAGGIMSDEVVSKLDAVQQTIILFQEKVSKAMATATADVLDFLSIANDNPKLFLKLFVATDLSEIEEFGKKAMEKREKLRQQMEQEKKIRAGVVGNLEDADNAEKTAKDEERSKQEILRAEVS